MRDFNAPNDIDEVWTCLIKSNALKDLYKIYENITLYSVLWFESISVVNQATRVKPRLT